MWKNRILPVQIGNNCFNSIYSLLIDVDDYWVGCVNI